MASNLAQRIAVSAVAIPLAVGAIWLGGWPLAAALAALGVLGTREVYDLARRQGIDALDRTGWVAAAAIPPLVYWGTSLALYLAALWLMAVLVVAMRRRGPSKRPLPAVAVTVFGVVYAAGLLAFLVEIRHGTGAGANPGAYVWLAVLPLAITWIGDTAAMAAGTTFGGRKLAPVLSPQKTWSGAIGGLVGALVASVLIGELILNRQGWHFAVWQLLVVGVVVSVVGQVGDIAESLLKREADVKDSSLLIPGHGGVLDRLDSLYFVIPAAAGLFKLYGVI
jgi:phosphatidate cytidylyltransferase